VSVQITLCSIRQVHWSFPCIGCPRCGRDAPRVWDTPRVAIDIDLDQPVILGVRVSVHVCSTCSRMFELFEVRLCNRLPVRRRQVCGKGCGLVCGIVFRALPASCTVRTQSTALPSTKASRVRGGSTRQLGGTYCRY